MACLCNAFTQRVRAGFGAALARVTSVPPPPFKYPASALRASAVAACGTRPPAVNTPHGPQSFHLADRFLLSPLGQLVDFPYRLGDVVDSQQSPGFVLIDRLGLLTLVDLVDFPIGQAPRRCPSWRKPSSSSTHAITNSPPPLWLRRNRHRLHRRLRFRSWRFDSRQRAPNAAISRRRSSPTYSTTAGFGLPECSNSSSPPTALRAPGALLSTRRIRVISP